MRVPATVPFVKLSLFGPKENHLWCWDGLPVWMMETDFVD